MPTYDYECEACHHTLELFQGINDPVKKKCPACGKNRLKRQFGTGAAIVFKGSGFYQTDYRSEGYKKAAKAEKASGESKSSDTKSSDSAGSSAKDTSASTTPTKSAAKAD